MDKDKLENKKNELMEFDEKYNSGFSRIAGD